MKKTSNAHYETLTAWMLALAFVALVAIPSFVPATDLSRPALIVDVGVPGASPSIDEAAIRRFPADTTED